MRIDCKYYESRTYPSGDTVRMCRLDLAPEAPWRCPADCKAYQRKTSDAGWVHGSLAPNAPDEPPQLDESAVHLLDAAEDIIHAVGPEIIEEVSRQRSTAKPARRWWWPFGRQ